MRSKLPEGWEEFELSNIAEYVNEKVTIDRCEIDKYISTANMIENKGGIVEIDNLPKAKSVNSFKIGDVLISNIRPYFKKIWFADFDGTNSSDVLILRSNENTYNKFLYYVLSNDYFFDYTTKSAKGTKMPRGDKNAIMEYLVPKINIEEQKAIADTLSSLDDKIELNNKINENLEKQAQAIFKHWFVDFEFPNEEGKPYKSSGGEMIDSELGMIPKGWEVGGINKYFDIAIGRTPPRKKTYYFSENKEDMTWISIADLGKSGVFISESKEKLTDKAFEDFNIRIIPKDTVLMSFKLTIGRIAITNKEVTTNEAIAHFVNKEINMTKYLYLYLKVFEFERLGNTSSIGTAINSTIVKKMPFLKPDKETLNHFKNIINPIFKNIKNLETQNQKLSQLRDTLLPKLMSGEIRIPLD